MEQTALNKAIDGIKNIKADILMRGGVNDYTKVASASLDRVNEYLQSLLPVEQEQRDRKCIDLLDYIINNCELDESGLFITINGALDNAELLQLFNQQNMK